MSNNKEATMQNETRERFGFYDDTAFEYDQKARQRGVELAFRDAVDALSKLRTWVREEQLKAARKAQA
jgi:hypothetical protein